MLLIKCRRLKRGYLSMKDNDTFGWLSTSHRKKLVLIIVAILMVCILECVRLGIIMTELLPYMNVYKDTDEPYVDPGNAPEESGVLDVPVSEPAAATTGSN